MSRQKLLTQGEGVFGIVLHAPELALPWLTSS
jgi:hypothetical protein